MADNSNTNGNSWTILPPDVKESGVESMGPLSEGQEELHAEPVLTHSSALLDTPAEQTHPPDLPQVTPLEGNEDAAVLPSTTVKGDAPSRSLDQVENLTSLTPDPAERGASGETSKNQPLIETESFSDSYTHISPSPVYSSIPGAPEDDELELSQGEEKSELRKTLREEFKPEEKANDGDGLRRRNVSVLPPLYHRGEEEEEEGEEEQFRHPQRDGEGDIGFTLNKCIFGALVLLGLGTIFFSGVLFDLDDEGDADSMDLKYPQEKKEWLNADAQTGTPGGVQPPDILDELAKENQQIASLEDQLQKQEVDFKDAQLQVEESTKERLRREELEAENQRMKEELDKLPAFQKEYQQESERAKKENERVNKELEVLPVLQKELERLRDQVTELTQGTANVQAGLPSAGHEEVLGSSLERKERKDKKAWDKERIEKALKAEKKEWKKDKNLKVTEQDGKGKSAKDGKDWQKEDIKQGRLKEEGKNGQKDHKKEDAQRWKLDHGKREPKERTGKREWREEKKWEKEKHDEFVEERGEKREIGKEGKEWKQKREHKDLKEEKEWKKDKQASRNDKEWKEQSEKKEWKERKEWSDEREKGDDKYKSDKSQKEKTRRGKKDHHNENGERREREEKRRGGKEEDKPKRGGRAEEWKAEKKNKDRKNHKEEKVSGKDKHEASHHLYSDRKRSKDHVHVDYWAKQREKVRHFYGSTEGCADVTACARAEGLAPVSQQDFEAFVSGYLTKLQGNQDQISRKEELNKLIGEFFTDGVFVHDQIPFSEFVEDVEDILEDMADDDDDEDDDDEDDDDDDELENVMDEFAVEAMVKFMIQEKEGNEEKRGGRGKKRMKG